jgi:hypothetical protein
VGKLKGYEGRPAAEMERKEEKERERERDEDSAEGGQ